MDPITLTPDQSVKFKIKVQGVEKEVILKESEVIEHLQKSEDYTLKTQALSEKEKALKAQEESTKALKAVIDEMEANPQLKETLNKVYSDFKSGKLSKSEDKKTDNLRKLDRLIEETTDAGERERLRDIRDIIKEEGGVEEINLLKTEIKTLKDELSIIKGAAITGVSERIERDISILEEKFGKDLVAKYADDIRKTAIKYPQNSIPKIFKYLCPDDEYERAVLDVAKKKEQMELERKKKGSLPNETTFTPKTELKKDQFGRVSVATIAQRVRERLGK
jgi:hypothetical protein